MQRGCEEVAKAIQKAIGGEIKTIDAVIGGWEHKLGGVRDIGGTIFKNPAGAGSAWFSHAVVVQGGRVYDGLTGPAGQPINEYKDRWQYKDAIKFGF